MKLYQNWHVWIFGIPRSQFNCETLWLTQYKQGDNLQPPAKTNIDCNGKLRENSLDTRVLRRYRERSVFLMLHSSPNMLLCLVGILSISNWFMNIVPIMYDYDYERPNRSFWLTKQTEDGSENKRKNILSFKKYFSSHLNKSSYSLQCNGEKCFSAFPYNSSLSISETREWCQYSWFFCSSPSPLLNICNRFLTQQSA